MGHLASPDVVEKITGEFHGERSGPVQPTEKAPGKALKARFSKILASFPSLHFVYPDRTKPTVLACRQALLGSIEAGCTNRVISPCYFDISPSAPPPAQRSRREPISFEA